ncbi:cobyrinate a,c-diamide synthase [uncultured Bilophila sp.]|uniref:cobyrinate a,c-diamide synthase n=1 Tax=uncultured Bilophila sp. TaxID=529385 RepID=UPI00280BBDF7|nr:cobyrinate a,c-diamide synthase [uncultured Bilophila sp.]
MIIPTFTAPRLVVSGLSGGGGKTLVSLGLARALTLRGLRVKPYKKGPDYIDAAWLSLASGRTPTNLDPFFLPDARLRALFRSSFGDADLAVIEGNRGLYDGRDVQGSCSTATLARALDAPVLLTLSVTKMTRTAAAVIAGLAHFEPVNLAGVVLNRVASSRHAALIRQSIETYTGIPVLGEIPRLAENPIPERHMGLVSMHDESPDAPGRASLLAALDSLAALIEGHMDVDAALRIARSAPDLRDAGPFWEDAGTPAAGKAADVRAPRGGASACPENIASEGTGEDRPAALNASPQSHGEPHGGPFPSGTGHPSLPGQGDPAGQAPSGQPPFPARLSPPVSIGFVRDAALWFYYEENFEALRRAGAELVELSLLSPEPWPGGRLDGLYLGGGFPEMVPERLAVSPHLAEIRSYSMRGMPIYAECGGFMVLCRELRIGGKDYPMAGLFPARAEFCPRPQGLGYVEATVEAENPFHPVGALLRGHEFHYSRCVALGELEPTLRLSPGVGMSGPGHRAKGLAAEGDTLASRDGLLVRNTFAAYTHLFAPAVPHWATRFVAACRKNK